MRFIERRREAETETRASLDESLKQIAQRGLRWVDHLNYFGPDRRRNTNNTYIGPERRVGGEMEVMQQPSLLDKARSGI